MSDSEPIQLRPRTVGRATTPPFGAPGQDGAASLTVFNRQELNEILALYGRMVAMGEWRDYAIDMGRDRAVFSIFRRSSECPLFRIEKNPKMARKQGAYSVVAATGLILKRGHELGRVLRVLEKSPRLVR